jgi:hypothetical protein
MDQNELKKHLSQYATKIKSGQASTTDFSDIKNKIRASYDAGHLDKEAMTDLGKAASHNFKNRFSSKGLSDLPNKIVEKGGMIGKLEEAAEPVIGKVVRSAKEAGKKVRSFGPLLGMLGAGAAAMGVGNKAMAGDLGGAGMDAADLATDYVPGLSQAKMALQSDEVGKGSDQVQGKEAFDFTPYKTEKKLKFGNLRNKLAGK